MGYARYYEFGAGLHGPPPRLFDRSGEVRLAPRLPPGALARVHPDRYRAMAARLACWATHHIALDLGLVEPGVPCCWHCGLVPLSAATWPG